MASYKSQLKQFFIYTKTLPLLDKLNYFFAKIKHSSKNKEFKKENIGFKLPPDYYLYETYLLDYKQYKEDGFLSAQEICEWTFKYLNNPKSVLEWGCGVSRIIRHFYNFTESNTKLFACDINSEMINWNKNNIENIVFDKIEYHPPTLYQNSSFDLVFAISVFTHIESSLQLNWIQEIARITKPNGVFLFTTHGTNYLEKMTNAELLAYNKAGCYTISYKQKGHRMMTTYNNSQSFERMLQDYFDIVEFYDGQKNKEKAGGQDLWITKRKETS